MTPGRKLSVFRLVGSRSGRKRERGVRETQPEEKRVGWMEMGMGAFGWGKGQRSSSQGMGKLPE